MKKVLYFFYDLSLHDLLSITVIQVLFKYTSLLLHLCKIFISDYIFMLCMLDALMSKYGAFIYIKIYHDEWLNRCKF